MSNIPSLPFLEEDEEDFQPWTPEQETFKTGSSGGSRFLSTFQSNSSSSSNGQQERVQQQGPFSGGLWTRPHQVGSAPPPQTTMISNFNPSEMTNSNSFGNFFSSEIFSLSSSQPNPSQLNPSRELNHSQANHIQASHIQANHSQANHIQANYPQANHPQPNPLHPNPIHPISNLFSGLTIISPGASSEFAEELNRPSSRSSYTSEQGERTIGSYHESEGEESELWEDPGSSRSPEHLGEGFSPHEHPQGEHPSRTLFVRNINSNVEDEELRKLFDQYGPIRNMYTHCKHRGFVMISYFDIRHAKNAMRQLQGKPLRRRRLDIHYSIPKENPSEKDQNQGTLVVFNLDSSTTNEDLKEIFGQFGEIKEIRETPNKKYHKFIEFYDVRDAEKAMKQLNKTEISGKKIKIEVSRPGGKPKPNTTTLSSLPGGMMTSPGSAPTVPGQSMFQGGLSEDEEALSLPDYLYQTNFQRPGSYPNSPPNSNLNPTSQSPLGFSPTGHLQGSPLNQMQTGFGVKLTRVSSHEKGPLPPSNPYVSLSPPQPSFQSINSPGNGPMTPTPVTPRSPPNSSLFSDFLFPGLGGQMNFPNQISPSMSPPPTVGGIIPPRPITQHRATDEDKIRYALNLGKVRNGQDIRTTLMIKNIPNKYSQKMLLASVDSKFKGSYDFFYLPIDFKNKCNVGYAFINFIMPEFIIGFYEEFNNKKWEKFNSDKVCEITYARIQGKYNLIQHFQNSSLMSEDKKCRPIIFHSEGPFVGEQEPFPIGPKVKPRLKENETADA